MNRRRSLRAALFAHDNDYGFDPVSPPPPTVWPSVTCVVPYHETGELATRVVCALQRSLAAYRRRAPEPKPGCRVIVVDDGSLLRAFREPAPEDAVPLEMLRLPGNRGRSAARNAGLHAAGTGGAAVTAFVDSDVLVSEDHVANMIGAMHPLERAIAAGLFLTTPATGADELREALACARVENDWRYECVYESSWIGCDADLEFVGRRFRLLAETAGWRRWSGMVGPWCLANMALGGCVAVPTERAIACGGFEETFDRYGFTETTLVAKLIAGGCFLVPVLGSTALHIEGQPAHLPQAERNRRFRDAHERFFGEFIARAA